MHEPSFYMSLWIDSPSLLSRGWFQMNMPYPGMPGSPPGVSPTAMQGPYQPQPYYPGPPPPYYGEQPGYPQPNYAPPAYSYPQVPPHQLLWSRADPSEI